MPLAPHQVTLREATPADEPLIRRLFADSRAADFAQLPGADAAVQALIDLQFTAQAAMFATRFPAGRHEIILDGADPVGRIVTANQPDGIRLIDITVESAHQSRGIGTAVLTALLEQADSSGRTVELSVWELNERVTRLYARLGFSATEAAGGYLTMRRRAPSASGVAA
ncbi:N-acetyltransferase family protein [Leifsonia sp. YAF41]|uniref:GNAT family N-acetyltransferase n=1 Tax=Leifsonia sp. YAF41 TaxID=3233086 RepID=UPI003F9BFDF2